MTSSTSNIIRRLIKPQIIGASAYHVQDARGMIKLDAMENPYTWPDPVVQGWLDCLADIEINRYPEAGTLGLREKLKSVYAIPEECGILLGNGSDEIIQLICLALAGEKPVIMSPDPSFAMYRIIAGYTGAEFTGVSLADDLSLDLESMLQAIDEHQPDVIFIARPNNPTGGLFPETDISRIIETTSGLVVVDEAYHEFAGSSFLPRISDHDNVLILRTLSKLGLAGLRLGFLIGSDEWIHELDKVRLPYNINVLTQKSTEYILGHFEILSSQARTICRDREKMYAEMKDIKGLQVWPSATNFLLFRPESVAADKVFDELRQRGILIKNLNGSHPLLKECLRVTVGTESENAKFIAELKQVLVTID